MSDELKEKVEQLISYYDHHSMSDFVHGNDERLKNFVIDDFNGLLNDLSNELNEQYREDVRQGRVDI